MADHGVLCDAPYTTAMNDSKNEIGKGYVALRIFTGMAYIGCFAYTVFAITLTLKSASAALMVYAGLMSFVGVYVLDRVAKAVFIIRDRGSDAAR